MMTDPAVETGKSLLVEQLLAQETCAPLQRGEIRRGEVIAIWPSYVVMDIRAKREGFVPKRDLERLDPETREQVVVGAEFPVYVVRPEDIEGGAIVSISRGLVQNDWDRAYALSESEEIWEGEVVGHNRGGLLVQFGRIRAFVPSSHLVGFPRALSQDERHERLAERVGQQLGFRVIEVHQRRNRLVLSERAARREWRELQMERLLNELEEGQLVQGCVSSIRDFGAFVDLGGGDGLIHISELSWRRIDHPREVVRVGEEIEVRVIRLDPERKRISLSLRRARQDPWDRVEERYALGQLITGRVTRVHGYGAFIELEEGLEGLVHVSELADQRVADPGMVVEEGEVVLVRVIRLDPLRRRIGLSLRRVTVEEWSDWRAQRVHIEQSPGETDEELLSEETPAPAVGSEAVEAEAVEASVETAAEEIVEAEAVEAGVEAVAEEAVEADAVEARVETAAEEDVEAEAVEAGVEAVAEEAVEADAVEASVEAVAEEAVEAEAVEAGVEAVAEEAVEAEVLLEVGGGPVGDEPEESSSGSIDEGLEGSEGEHPASGREETEA